MSEPRIVSWRWEEPAGCEPCPEATTDAMADYVVQREALHADRERIQAIRSCGWTLLGIASSLENGEAPTHTVGEVVERLRRVAEGERCIEAEENAPVSVAGA